MAFSISEWELTAELLRHMEQEISGLSAIMGAQGVGKVVPTSEGITKPLRNG